MRVLDLFSGIGGFSLGSDWAGGFETVAFCECEPYPVSVLKTHWPDVPVFPDVRKLYKFASDYQECDCCGEPFCELCNEHFADCDCFGCSQFDDEVGGIDVITAGFPCQDVSSLNQFHGDLDGTDGERSGLFREVIRLVCNLRPKYAVLENVTDLLVRGFGDIAGELVQIGYDCEWHCIPASAVGAEHARDRIFIIAYPAGFRMEGVWPKGVIIPSTVDRKRLSVRDSNGQWKVEPCLLRATNGVPCRLDRPNRSARLKALGNAVVPQVAQLIFEAIHKHFREK